jgi:hypothetical protein
VRPASANATATAAIIARERDAELIVVHVRAPEVMRVGRLGPTLVHDQRLRDPHSSGVLAAPRRGRRWVAQRDVQHLERVGAGGVVDPDREASR